MTNRKRLLAILLCAVFLLTAVSASAFLATHLEHRHTEKGCLTCVAIHTAGQLLAGLRHAVLLLAVLAALSVGAVALCRPLRRCLRRMPTLCSLHVLLTE